jgi:transcriptional regulator
MVRDRAWAPTWNFARAQFQVALDFFEEQAAIEAHLRKLVGIMEGDRATPWSLDEMGPRFAGLSRGIVGFHASIVAADQRFKLGQDERPEIFSDICESLGDAPLTALMRRQN